MRMGPTTVVYLVSTLRRTAPTNQLLNITRYLDRKVFAPLILTLSPEPEDSMCSEFERVDVPLKSFGWNRWRGALPKNWRKIVWDAADQPESDSLIVHSQGIRADGIAARHLTGSRRIATLRNIPCEDYRMKFGRLRGAWMAKTHLNALRALPRVVVCSANQRAHVARHGVEACVIHDGVDIERFQPSSEDQRSEARRRLGFEASGKVIVSVGAFVSLKDPLTIIRAFRGLAGENLQLAMLGNGPILSDARAMTAGDQRVRFTGQVTNVSDYLRVADCFVSASLSEGLPNAVLEALACGVPVVLSDIPAHREVLSLDPQAGRLFPLKDVAQLQAGVLHVLSEDHRVMRGHARTLAQSAFSAASMAAAYQSLYQALSRSSRQRRP